MNEPSLRAALLFLKSSWARPRACNDGPSAYREDYAVFTLIIRGVVYGMSACGLLHALLLMKLFSLTSGASASTGRSTLLSSLGLFAPDERFSIVDLRFIRQERCHDH
jgi:hypothetical protein